MKSRIALVALLTGLVLVSGCAQFTFHTTVNADGEISERKMQINTSRTVYGFLEQGGKEKGYDSIKENILSQGTGLSGINQQIRRENIEYNEEFRGSDVTITIKTKEPYTPKGGNTSITKKDGKIVYEDTTFLGGEPAPEEGKELLSGLALDYYLTMPGEITDSSADTVEGNKAEWHTTGPDGFKGTRIYAESEVPSSPGLTSPAAIVALVLGVLAALAREKG